MKALLAGICDIRELFSPALSFQPIQLIHRTKANSSGLSAQLDTFDIF